jgi:hypothetical protein
VTGKEPGIQDCFNRRPIMKFINKLIRDEAGATAIEHDFFGDAGS